MIHRKTSRFTFKLSVALVFLFSVFISYSNSSFRLTPITGYLNENAQLTANCNFSLFEFSTAGQHHQIPEAPYDAAKKEENEKEKDDDNNESLVHSLSVHEVSEIIVDKGEFLLHHNFFENSALIPFYILFHSWKSFLV